MSGEHERIWLQPFCFYETDEGRLWCQDDMGPCEDCGKPSVEYVRADLHSKLIAQNEAMRRALEQIAEQKTSKELIDTDDWPCVNFEDGYDEIVEHARAALPKSGEDNVK